MFKHYRDRPFDYCNIQSAYRTYYINIGKYFNALRGMYDYHEAFTGFQIMFCIRYSIPASNDYYVVFNACLNYSKYDRSRRCFFVVQNVPINFVSKLFPRYIRVRSSSCTILLAFDRRTQHDVFILIKRGGRFFDT